MRILLITPPFTQLNTPYPATAYIKGFLSTLGIEASQADLGLEVILELFSRKGLEKVFQRVEDTDVDISDQAYRIFMLKDAYLATIDHVIRFLQHKNPMLAHSICSRKYLPEGHRFSQMEDLEWAFGTMGIQDEARHLATLYLEDLGDLITEAIDPHFGFSRYAERLGRTATHFDPLLAELEAENSLIAEILIGLLANKIAQIMPDLVCFSVPFPGNLFGALKCGQYIKKHYPNIKIAMGGGYANTELRSLADERLFDFTDFVSLDDGEAPLKFLLEYLAGKREQSQLKRIFMRSGGVVTYCNGAPELDIAQRETGTPDYSDLKLNEYLSVIEIVNPMHRLWSDGRWNKLTLAHGCYWGKCSFCDITLDYIKNYEPITAAMLCDRMETIIAQTGQTGFHFVDEAAPPALMRDLAIEIIKRRLTIVWWTNIRFEKSFTRDLCALLKASGCIAVSGGLEVASDRLLARMQKGVTVAQVARVADAFTSSGIMVHAYLMYGFPTQTDQETIDSLEMVRQLFESGVLQSGFWHQFAMTAHSPVGLAPTDFEVQRIGPDFGGFADNDLFHLDPTGADHEKYSEGLKKSLFNYMHGAGFDLKLQSWFPFKVPRTTVAPGFIEQAVAQDEPLNLRPSAMVIWPHPIPDIHFVFEKQGKKEVEMAEIHGYRLADEFGLVTEAALGRWMQSIMPRLTIGHEAPMTLEQVRKAYTEAALGDFDTFVNGPFWAFWRQNGLLVL